MENQKIKKFNVVYMLIYILAPILLIVLLGALSMMIQDEQIANTVILVVSFLSMGAIIWLILGWNIFYKNGKKKMAKELDDSGFVRNHTFNGDGCTIVVDVVHGNIALLFRMNPFQVQRFSAKRVEKAWVDDGKSGPGILQGSSRVSFLLLVDGIKVRVNTFTSNQRWKMDSDYILTGISKADMMVEVIREAMGKAQ